MGHMGEEQHALPCSEIAALQAVCCRADPQGPPIECWSDCKFGVDTFAALMGPQGVDCTAVKHGSIWEEIRARVMETGLSITVRWCKAHTRTQLRKS